jgi:hypothetical protein
MVRRSFDSFQLQFFVSFLLVLSTRVQSGWTGDDLIPGSRYTSARLAALGDSALSLDDSVGSGLFYNPANLAKIRKPTLEIGNYSLYANSGVYSHLGLNSYQVFNLNANAQNLQNNSGTAMGAGWAVFPNVGFAGFGLGVLVQSQVAGTLNSDQTVTYRTQSQLIPTVGYGFRLLDGALRFGYSLQFVNQAVGAPTASNNASLSYTAGLAQGSGFSHTFGLSISPMIRYMPTLSLVVRNAFGTSYSSTSLVSFSESPHGVPSSEPMSFDASLSWSMRVEAGVMSRWSLTYRDLSDTAQSPLLLLHTSAGLELSFKDRFFLRAGLREGYPSAGLGVGRPGAELSFAYYTYNVGDVASFQPDTRVMLHYRAAVF